MPKQIIPYAIYNLEEAAEVLGVDRKTMYQKVKTQEIESKLVGKGHKFLGENLLRFMGSPSISRLQPDSHLEDLDLEHVLDRNKKRLAAEESAN